MDTFCANQRSSGSIKRQPLNPGDPKMVFYFYFFYFYLIFEFFFSNLDWPRWYKDQDRSVSGRKYFLPFTLLDAIPSYSLFCTLYFHLFLTSSIVRAKENLNELKSRVDQLKTRLINNLERRKAIVQKVEKFCLFFI